MKNTIRQLFACLALTGTFMGLIGCKCFTASTDRRPSESVQIRIVSEPEDQFVPLGGSASFTVGTKDKTLRYQWLAGCDVIPGATNSTLYIARVTPEDVRRYSCIVSKGTEFRMSQPASLTTFSTNAAGIITGSGMPTPSGGNKGTCPGCYAGLVNIRKTVAAGWGWRPTATETVHSAADPVRTDTRIEYNGSSGDTGCGVGSVTIPHPPVSAKYRFVIYFPCGSPVPTQKYDLVLTGFAP